MLKDRVQNILEGNLVALERESEYAEVQWKNIKECVLDTISDLVGKVERRVMVGESR
jgi:kynureninase